MAEFKVGDRVRLLPGHDWDSIGLENKIVEIAGIDEDGDAYFLEECSTHPTYPCLNGEQDAELVTDHQGEYEAGIGARFAEFGRAIGNGGVSVADLEAVRTTGEELGGANFATEVNAVTSAIAVLLVEKNEAYGNSALDPVRVFSKASAEEQLLVRIDDKLSRIQRGHEYADEDTVNDLIGYLVLLKIARNRGE